MTNTAELPIFDGADKVLGLTSLEVPPSLFNEDGRAILSMSVYALDDGIHEIIIQSYIGIVVGDDLEILSTFQIRVGSKFVATRIADNWIRATAIVVNKNAKHYDVNSYLYVASNRSEV